jgi:hypothetical protein
MVKIVFQDINGYLLARAPAWAVVLVNRDSKLIFECDYEHWLKRPIRRSYLAGEESEPDQPTALVKGGKTLYAGKGCTWYFVPNNAPKAVNKHRAEYFVIESPIVSRQGCRILEKWFAVPFLDAIPLAIKWHDIPNGETGHAPQAQTKEAGSFPPLYTDPVDCRSISEKTVPGDFFAYPQNMHKVTSELQIFATQKKKEEFEGILKELGGEKKTDKGKPPKK